MNKPRRNENQENDLKLFIDLFGDIDESRCEFTDESDPNRPDLIVRGRSIGIEHTRLSHEDPAIPGGRWPRPQEKIHWKLLQRAHAIFRRQSQKFLSLHAMFTEPFNYRDRNEEIEREADLLAQSVLAVLSRCSTSETDPAGVHMQSWQAQRLGLPFPQGIDVYVYTVVRDPAMALWAPAYSYAVPILTGEEVEERIREKECRLAAYRTRCDTIWLLMVTDAGTLSSHFDITDALKQHRFTTLFDRLFLLLPFQRQLIELQVSR